MSSFLPTDASFIPRFLRLAIVNIVSNLMVPLAGLLDVAFLGHLTELHYLAGVALATVLFNYLYWTFGFLRMGTTGLTAQAVGRHDQETVWLILLRHVGLALAIGGAIVLLQIPIRTIGFSLLNAAPDVQAAGQEYFNGMIWGAPATLLNMVLMGWFLGREKSRQVLLLSIVNNGCKVGLDYVLIVQLGWQSLGAGYATAISQSLMLLVGLGFVLREANWSTFVKLSDRLGDGSALMAILRLNGDIVIRTFALVSAFSIFTMISSSFGTTVLGLNTILLQVITLAAYFIDGIAFATESFAGIFRGQGNTRQLRQLIGLGGGISLGLGVLFAVVYSLFPPLFRLLTDHASVLAQIPTYVPWLLPILGFGSIAYFLDGYFLGLTEGRILRQSSLIATCVGFAPMAAIAAYCRNVHLLWLALALLMLGRAATLALQVPTTLQPTAQENC